MLIRQLQYLVALHKHGHFGRAAEACLISQPTLSAAIRQLEQNLGTSLVKRGHRFHGFTHDGEVVLQWSRRILADCDAMRDQLQERPEGIFGQLRVGGVPSALPLITILTTKLTQRHPRVTVEITEMPEHELLRALLSFEIDSALIYRDMVPLGKCQISRSLFKERFICLTPVDGPLADRSTATWEELASIPLCLPSKETRYRKIIDDFLGGHYPGGVQIEADSLMSLCAHVCSGHWSTIMPHAFLYPFGTPNGTKAIGIVGPQGSEEVCLAISQTSPIAPLVRELMQLAEETDIVQELREALGLPSTPPSTLRPGS